MYLPIFYQTGALDFKENEKNKMPRRNPISEILNAI